MWERVPRWVCEQWPGPRGRLRNINGPEPVDFFYIGTDLPELDAHLDRMLHHQLWREDLSGNIVEPLGWDGERV